MYADRVKLLNDERDKARAADGYNFQADKDFKAEHRKVSLPIDALFLILLNWFD